MKKILLVFALIAVSLTSCKKDEEQTISTLITITASFEDDTFDPPQGKILLFDVTEEELESHYLSVRDEFITLRGKDDEIIWPYMKKNIRQSGEEKYSEGFIYTNYIDDEFSRYPNKMLLYMYIEKPTHEYKDMYSFTEINVGEKDFEFTKSLTAIIPETITDYGNEFIEWE